MGALVDSRRTRTAAGALLELSAMANEKLLLHKELDRWKVRHVEIRRRLAEISAKERRLMGLVQAGPGGLVACDLPATAFATAGTGADGEPDAPCEPPPGRRVRVKEFTY
jgi:hypothetical protein